MKVIIILLAVILVAFLATQIFVWREQQNIETYSYVVNKKYEGFEIRSYEPALFSTVKLSTKDYKASSSKGFSILAGYIFGENDRKEMISMTSPVTMSLEDSTTMMFMVPKKFEKASLPQPNRSEIEFREEPAKTVAVINFYGWANDEKIEKYKQKLKSALDAENIIYINGFYFLGYNPPFEVFNRRNEIIVELPSKTLDLIKK